MLHFSHVNSMHTETESVQIRCESQWNNEHSDFSIAEFQPILTYCWMETKLCKRYNGFRLDAVLSEESAKHFLKRKIYGRYSELEMVDGWGDDKRRHYNAYRCGDLLCMDEDILKEL